MFKDTTWLDGRHDGRRLMPFADYVRSCEETHRSQGPKAYAAQFQCLYTFGLLEAVIETKYRTRKVVPPGQIAPLMNSNEPTPSYN
ncbi:hypothetical protein PYCCODRAFT_1440716 [Trametes coccinea BRFM310]|uniref:Uncharacterized protein n=1 Tax=Trametes coccinea (strain BRFM310) TaxID=1353009 RepID=A0A1Y2I6U4_TRAC3|nr:hypothetical protein PYCCODRAFT_1440716 [Trametes coccinea BRFM310]